MISRLRQLWMNRSALTGGGLAGQTLRTRKGAAIGVCVLALVLTSGYFAVGALFVGGAERDLTSDDSTRVLEGLAKIDNEKLKSEKSADLRNTAAATLKEGSLGAVFDRMRSDDISDEERDRLRGNLRTLMMDQMKQRVDEYHEAPADQQEAIMDRHIDEMLALRKKMEEYREQNKDDSESREGRERFRGPHGPRSTQERKARMEGTNPDRMVRMFKYWSKMRARAKARGVDMRHGPSSRRGRG